jgi:hypothetical protein
MKSEVYSWRLSAELKAEIEEQARSESKSMSALLEELASNGLRDRRRGRSGRAAVRAILLRRVLPTVGTIRSGDPNLASNVSRTVRARIARKLVGKIHAPRRTD